MERRGFLKRGATLGGAFLVRDTLSYAQRNLGLGGIPQTTDDPRTPLRSTTVAGGIRAVDGTAVSVDLAAREPESSGRVVVLRREYPTGAVLGRGVGERVELGETGQAVATSVEVPRNERNPGRWFYEVYVDADRDDEGPAYVAESAPYRWRGDEGSDAEPAERVTEALASASHEQFTRYLDGDEYVLTFGWQDFEGDIWTVDYRLRRSVHEAGVAAERGYVKTYEESVSSAVARDFAATVATEARRRNGRRADAEGESGAGEPGDAEREGATVASLDPARQFDVLVQFVQGLEYASDDATLGTYDYNRTVPETLVAGVGDCQERTYLLAGLLASTFDCDTALLFQVGHVFLGVDPDTVPGLLYDVDTMTVSGAEYVPIEPSLEVPVGYYPDEPIIAAYDGGWRYWNLSAMARGIGPTVREWVATSTPVPNLL